MTWRPCARRRVLFGGGRPAHRATLGAYATAAALSGASALAQPALPVEIEPNDSLALANDASRNFGPFSGNLFQLSIAGTTTSSDLDYFAIGALQAGDVLTVSMGGLASARGTHADPVVRVYRAGTTGIVVSDDDAGPGVDALIYRFVIANADAYYVRASGFNSTDTGTYQVGVFVENAGPAPTTGGTFSGETEINNSIAAANNASNSWRAVNYLSTTTAAISSGDVDVLRYEFTAGDRITVNIDSVSGLDVRVNLRNAAGTLIALEDGTSGGPVLDSPIYAFVIPTSGAYYVETLAASGVGSYVAQVYLSTNTPPPQGACLPNCDASTAAPVLNVGDFTCFLQKYALGDPYANCDGSTAPPALNVGDFTCFLQKYAIGCP